MTIKGLKALEALERIKREAGFPHFSSLYDVDMWREDFATVKKALVALEIIKRYISVKKGFYDQCWIVIGDYSINISKEKYDILKEELLCD